MSIHLSKLIFVYCLFMIGLIGAVLGSFLNCVAYRISHHTSFSKGRSHCPNCNHVLGPLDLIPIFSWVFQKGRCRYCHERISLRYPLTELIFMCLSIMCLLQFDLTIIFIRNYVLLCCLFVLSLVDFEIFEIPDSCIVIPILTWGILNYFIKESWMSHIGAALLYGGGVLILSLIMDRLLHKESMGGGDIKLLFVMGLYLGIVGGMLALLISCILGIVSSYVLKKDEESHFPFGPAISIAFVIVLYFGQPMIHWYLSLL